jgi:drug/metabolite transporter (DMT)-like permease
MTLQIGILLAFLCAVFSNLGFFFKHRGACAAARRSRSAPAAQREGAVDLEVVRRSAWSSAAAGWALHVAAISFAPLSVVQVVLSGGVVLIAVMADRMFGFSVGRRQWWGLALTAAGLILLGVTMPDPTAPTPPSPRRDDRLRGRPARRRRPAHPRPARRRPAEHHGVMLAAAAGILFGVCNVAVKALSGMVGDHGILGLASPRCSSPRSRPPPPSTPPARSLQDGEAVEVIAITGTAANIAGIAGGIIVFGDPMPAPRWASSSRRRLRDGRRRLGAHAGARALRRARRRARLGTAGLLRRALSKAAHCAASTSRVSSTFRTRNLLQMLASDVVTR